MDELAEKFKTRQALIASIANYFSISRLEAVRFMDDILQCLECQAAELRQLIDKPSNPQYSYLLSSMTSVAEKLENPFLLGQMEHLCAGLAEEGTRGAVALENFIVALEDIRGEL